jgi:thiol-disulfide isomerase/thioredoxin
MNRARRSLVALLAVLAGSPATAAGAAKPRVISRADLDGAIKHRQGRPLLLHVWASWCQPCVRELPLVTALVREARARGLDVSSVSLDEENERAVARMARVLKLPGGAAIDRTILRMDDPDAVVAQIDPDWEGDIPAFFAYDKAGKLRRAHVGEMTRQEFERLIGDLAPPIVKK